MKEMIVCEKIKRPFGMHPDYGVDILENSLIYTRKVEKVPENWEELKDLCKDIKEVTITEEGHINVDLVYFTKDGEIYTYIEGVLMNSLSLPVSKDRTPQQMWQIIKSLIGE